MKIKRMIAIFAFMIAAFTGTLFLAQSEAKAAPYLKCPASQRVNMVIDPGANYVVYVCSDRGDPDVVRMSTAGYRDLRITCPTGRVVGYVTNSDKSFSIGCVPSGTTVPFSPSNSVRPTTFFQAPAYVNTAPAACYAGNLNTGDNFRVVACSTMRNAVQLQFGQPPQAGFCYWRFGGSIIRWGAISAECQRARDTVAPDPVDPDDPTIGNPDRDAIANCRGSDCINQNPIVIFVKIAINFLSAIVAVVVAIVIIMAGIQYSSSGGNPQATGEAKKRILNAIIALVAYFSLYVFFQWLIPGGPF